MRSVRGLHAVFRRFDTLLRRQLPAYSPLSFADLLRSLKLSAATEDRARESLKAWLGDRFASESVSLTGSGTDALRLALTRTPKGGLVAAPAYSCYDIVTACEGAGSRVVFYDIDPYTLSPDLSSFEAAIAAGARTAIVGYLYGFPVDWTSIKSYCGEAGVTLIEDAAQGIGTDWQDVSWGLHGDYTVFSFGRGKGWTGGGGGALVTHSNPEAPEAQIPDPGRSVRLARNLRIAATSTAQCLLGRPSLYWLPNTIPWLGLGESRYKAPRDAQTISRLSAALALTTRDAAAVEVSRRREIARRWERAFGSTINGATLCGPVSEAACGYLRLPCLLPSNGDATQLAKRLSHWGVAQGYPMPLPTLPAALPLSSGFPVDCPGAEVLARRLVTFPTHSMVPDSDIDQVLDGLRVALGWTTPTG